MTSPKELEHKFWKALRSDMTMMLGLEGVKDGHTCPMTAQLDPDKEDHGPIWFFTSKENSIVRALGQGNTGQGDRAIANFMSKGHDVFASIHGSLSLDTNRATIDKLWNKHVAAWYEHGKDDPKLALLRLDAEQAQIWLDASSLVAGIKVLLGADPKEEYKDKVAKVALR